MSQTFLTQLRNIMFRSGVKGQIVMTCKQDFTRNVTRQCSTGKRYIPRRAAMYVPGNDEKKLRKIPGMNVDCAIMDCEDGVALNRKEEARSTISKMLDELEFGRTECVVRVNSRQSGMVPDDLNTVFQAKKLPETLMLPKVDHPEDITWFADVLQGTLQRHLEQKLNLVIFVESAIGLLNLPEICKTALSSSHNFPFLLDGVVFGSDDFCADIGATRTTDGRELLYARQKLVLVAKAFKLHAIDMVHIDYKDLDGLKKYSLEGARMGFTGKQVIHPSQIPVVQESFAPSQEKVEWATSLIKAFAEHQSYGKGAFTFRGNMIDMPLLLQAKNIVTLSEAIESSAKPRTVV